ncbi:MAG: hypothetical protein N2595_06715 [bacterium]|nr:hypothetical protein [bacterium]
MNRWDRKWLGEKRLRVMVGEGGRRWGIDPGLDELGGNARHLKG